MKKNKNTKNEQLKIDLVYLYVDSNDSAWLEKKNKAQKECGLLDEMAVHECRFKNYEELKYSLRSVEKYANWINHIYIITDNQVPVWLDTKNPRVTIIDHKDIMPNDALPTFNSLAIESCIQNIPNLSEYFLCANDDTFFYDYVTPEFFYRKDGYPVCRFKHHSKYLTELYQQLLNNASDLIFEKFGKKYNDLPHHSIDAYRKSTWIECQKAFPESIKQMIYSKFRNSENCERVLYMYYALATKQGHYKKLRKIDTDLPIWLRIINYILKRYKKDSLYVAADNKNKRGLFNKVHPYLGCINDDYKATDEDREDVVRFFEECFPQKSEFEL